MYHRSTITDGELKVKCVFFYCYFLWNSKYFQIDKAPYAFLIAKSSYISLYNISFEDNTTKTDIIWILKPRGNKSRPLKRATIGAKELRSTFNSKPR